MASKVRVSGRQSQAVETSMSEPYVEDMWSRHGERIKKGGFRYMISPPLGGDWGSQLITHCDPISSCLP